MDPKLEAARRMMDSEDSEKRLVGAEYVFERARGDDRLDMKRRAARILKDKASHRELRETAEWFLRKRGSDE